MKDSINIGPAPFAEDCAQVGSADYHVRARKECNAFIRQLRRMFGEEPEGARLFIKSNPHDFGTYLDVECEYDDELSASFDYALNCESGPEEWDEEARRELQLETV